MIVRKNYFYTVSRSRQVALTELRVGFCNLNYDLKSNYSRTTIDKLHNISLFSFIFFFFVEAPLSEIHFILAATAITTDTRHLINAYYYLLLFYI